MSNPQQFIQGVLEKRQSQKPKLKALQQDLNDLRERLAQLRRVASEASASKDALPELRRRSASLVEGIAGLDGRINDALARTANLISRFGKGTINIGVAGKARQGKSTVLRAVSGLDGSVIPTSAGLPCAGAKSRIVNQKDDPHAEIEFYTASEFLREVVQAYYEELRLPNPPATLDGFERNLPLKPTFEKPEDHAVYDKLKELHSGIAAYRPYLSAGKKRH